MGEPWCAVAPISDWTEAYQSFEVSATKAKGIYSLNSQQMARNFHADPVWPTSTSVPVVGAMAIYGEGDSTVSGHTGIVIEVMSDGVIYRTEEGNTIRDCNPGNQREGYIVAQHTHKVGLPYSITGLDPHQVYTPDGASISA